MAKKTSDDVLQKISELTETNQQDKDSLNKLNFETPTNGKEEKKLDREKEKLEAQIRKNEEKLQKLADDFKRMLFEEDIAKAEDAISETKKALQKLLLKRLEEDSSSPWVLSRIVEMIKRHVQLGSAISDLSKERSSLGGDIKEIISLHPTGLESAKTIEAMHKVFFCGDAKATLITNRNVVVSLERALLLVGLKRLLGGDLIKISGSKLAMLAEEGKLFTESGEAVDLERLIAEEVIQYEVQTPKLVTSVGEIEPLEIEILDPDLIGKDLNELESLKCVSKATITFLAKAGYKKVGQLKGLGGVDFVSIPGIGEKRAMEIVRAIYKRYVG